MSITIIFIALTVAASFYVWNNPSIYQKWMMNPYRVKNNREYYRFITSGFIHQDYAHLFFNMFSFYLFGRVVEGQLDSTFFITLYLGGIIVSDIPTFLKHKNNARYNSLGASGGVASVVFSSILFEPVAMDICLLPGLCVKAFIYGILFLIFSYYQARRAGDNINHDAHFYGALFGVVFTIILMPEVLTNFYFEIKNWK